MEYNATTALLIVDVQNDFADPSGSLYVPGGEEVIPFINEQAQSAVDAGALVVYTQDWHPEETPHFQKFGGIWPVHCVAGTKGAEFHPDLDVVDGALRIKKGTGGEDGYSAFSLRDPETGEESSTGLRDQLAEARVERVAVVGLALDYCVKETALDAARKELQTTLLADGSLPVNMDHGDGARAVADMVEAGVTVS
jgi:nicotinamidase/pyrazinamidase